MNKAFAYRWLMGAVMALFFALQSYSLAHAAEHLDEPHQHECISCEVTVLADELSVALPALPASHSITTEAAELVHTDHSSEPYITPQGRAPPPRAPPVTL